MNRIFIFIFLLIISFQSKALAYDCKFNKIKIHTSNNNLHLGPTFMSLTYSADGKPTSMIGPIEELCKESDETNGIIVKLFFLDNKLVRIIFENAIIKNRILFKIANETYGVGFKKNQKKINKKETETYSVNKGDSFYFYGNFIGDNEFLEYFEITSNKYKDKFNEELLKREPKND